LGLGLFVGLPLTLSGLGMASWRGSQVVARLVTSAALLRIAYWYPYGEGSKSGLTLALDDASMRCLFKGSRVFKRPSSEDRSATQLARGG